MICNAISKPLFYHIKDPEKTGSGFLGPKRKAAVNVGGITMQFSKGETFDNRRTLYGIK